MRVLNEELPLTVLTCAALCLAPLLASGQQRRSPCRVAVIEGNISAGNTFQSPIGNGLELMLESLASGWIVRVLPAHSPRGQHDYAELATPPFRSVSPLLISTDFSFRAQDALAWNPRRFHFAGTSAQFRDLQGLYDAYEQAPAGTQNRRIAETKLAQRAAQSPEAELTILDAHLVQGTGDQAAAAAMVASHLKNSAHEVDQPSDGRSTPLGQLTSLRFRVRLTLPRSLVAAPGLVIERGKCL